MLITLWYRATIPFDTAQRFVQHIHAHRIDDAKQMIDPADLSKLPPEYWDSLIETEFDKEDGWLMSYTVGTLLQSRIVFMVGGDYSVSYIAEGRTVRVKEMDF